MKTERAYEVWKELWHEYDEVNNIMADMVLEYKDNGNIVVKKSDESEFRKLLAREAALGLLIDCVQNKNGVH